MRKHAFRPVEETVMKLLHIDSSALGTHSVTRELGRTVVETYVRSHPGTEVAYRDLAANPLPHWAPVADASDPAARSGGEAMDEFLAADVIVIGAPMYNFGIPSTLKAWIDRIVVAGKTFSYGANGPQGLVSGKRVIILSARGGVYSEGAASVMDFQEDYLQKVFGFIGITDVEVVRAEGVGHSPENKARVVGEALTTIRTHERLAA
jgi:FMN-dependent NADH-azoreductase